MSPISNEVRSLVLGLIIGLAIAAVFMRRTTMTEVVRDSEGRIVQILTLNNVTPVFGNHIYNSTQVMPRVEALPVSLGSTPVETVIP